MLGVRGGEAVTTWTVRARRGSEYVSVAFGEDGWAAIGRYFELKRDGWIVAIFSTRRLVRPPCPMVPVEPVELPRVA